MDNIEFIKTPDLNLASTLLCLGFGIDGMDNTNPTKILFLFLKTPEVQQQIDMYWKDQLLVNPKALSACRREIMTRLHDSNT